MTVLNRQNSVANQFLLELRDKSIQQNRARFRNNIERLGELMAYEISRKFQYNQVKVQTPLGTSTVNISTDNPVLITVLRAGLPYFIGFQHIFGEADCGFIGAYRKESDADLTINLDYLATPSLEGRKLIIIDPMLATGQSVIKSVNALLKHGTPKHVHIAALVAAPEGVELLEKKLSVSHDLWTWALDEKLNELFYIVPGLGDAGDLSFGEKL
ncbi:MAG: uracil phosphoribosyltransferase [Cyclobacteriaceae bacterium]|nr:uracil phosphoribosyltransferase [Cyclobacteriaceae bacterium]